MALKPTFYRELSPSVIIMVKNTWVLHGFYALITFMLKFCNGLKQRCPFLFNQSSENHGQHLTYKWTEMSLMLCQKITVPKSPFHQPDRILEMSTLTQIFG